MLCFSHFGANIFMFVLDVFVLNDVQITVVNQKLDTGSTVWQYRYPSLYARDKDRKNKLAYNNFAYKKTTDDRKLEDRFQKNGQFSVAYTRNRR